MRKWRVAALAAAVLAAAGCKDMGLHELQEASVAERAGVSELVQQTTPAHGSGEDRIVQLSGRNWMPTDVTHRMPATMVQPVGSAGGRQFFRLAWDEEPLDRLLALEGGTYVEYAEVY